MLNPKISCFDNLVQNDWLALLFHVSFKYMSNFFSFPTIIFWLLRGLRNGIDNCVTDYLDGCLFYS